MKKVDFTFIDLFAGIGGFHRALTMNGGKCIGFSEINNDAISCYSDNTGEPLGLNFGDITKVKQLPSHDLLTAGVPCQSWSIAGRNLGFDDDRGQLWNDTIYLLSHSRPKAFIFENVKGLVDPRNTVALKYIMDRIHNAGYHANYHVINSYDHGVLQNRIRIYIIGFLDRKFFEKFTISPGTKQRKRLGELFGINFYENNVNKSLKDLFGNPFSSRQMSLSASGGVNDYFLFNDIRNGDTTIHSWDLLPTTDRQKEICLLILRNRRKKTYGCLDGNPLSISQLNELDKKITQREIDELIELQILASEEYCFKISTPRQKLTAFEDEILSLANGDKLILDELNLNRNLKVEKIRLKKSLKSLIEKGAISCVEVRYDFKNTKISTGLNGVNRIFLPSSMVFSTLVASDTSDMVATRDINLNDTKDYRKKFIKEIYEMGCFRKITQAEACLLQGFPADYRLPISRARWMKLLGNSVSVPVIEKLCKDIISTGVFDQISKK